VGISGTTAIVGAWGEGSYYTGAAYIYTGVDSGSPIQTQFTCSGTGAGNEDWFGYSVGISGTTAIVGAPAKNAFTGAAYFYTEVDSVPSQETQLTYSSATEDYFGYSVGISGTTAIVGAFRKDEHIGAAYIYTGVGSVNPAQTELTNPYAGAGEFGWSVSISGTTAIVGAPAKEDNIGAAYIYTGVGSDNPAQIELTNPYAGAGEFGYSVGISGTTAIVGAIGKDDYTGAAYLYTGGNFGNQTPTELTASDVSEGDYFGWSVGISGTIAIVGAPAPKGPGAGAAYLYTGVNTGTPTEILKLTPSAGVEGEVFGYSVSIDGDNFMVGAPDAASGTTSHGGKAYVGQVSTFTTANAGNVTRVTEGLSFVSKTDWIIGDATSNNTVILSRFESTNNENLNSAWYSDTATVKATGKAVYIGKSNGASGNKLIVEGNLTTNKIYIGSANGANNNTLIVSANKTKGDESGRVTADEIHIGSESSQGNVLKLEGEVSVALVTPTTVWLHRGNMLIILGVNPGNLPLTPAKAVEVLADAGSGIPLKAGWLPDSESLITAANAEQLINTSTRADMTGYTIIRANDAGGPPSTPEPSTYALWGSSLLAGLVFLRHRRRRKE
jgi:MYXO-CTERM domain-containing protein